MSRAPTRARWTNRPPRWFDRRPPPRVPRLEAPHAAPPVREVLHLRAVAEASGLSMARAIAALVLSLGRRW